VTSSLLPLDTSFCGPSLAQRSPEGGTRLTSPCVCLFQEISGSFRLLSQSAGRTQHVSADPSGAKHSVMARQSDSSVEDIISTDEPDVAPTPGGHCIHSLLIHVLSLFTILYINPVRTSQETHYISTTKPNLLMLFRETVAVYFENHTEHTDTLCEQNAEIVPHRKHITSPLQRPAG
jgi:hypothetical protein